MLLPALGILLLMRTSSAINKHKNTKAVDRLHIVGSGIFALTPDAMGITFYVSLLNTCSNDLDIATRMWECCESLNEGEVDCSFIHLIGGYMGIIQPGESKNVTLFYPNLYVYNRIGECLVGVWYRNDKGQVTELRTKIRFNTKLTPKHVSPKIAAFYEVETRRMKRCQSTDEDILDNCKPVDCSRKYNGLRTFYSHMEGRCIPAVKCATTVSQNLPDVVYTPEGNTCSDMTSHITPADIKTLNSGRGVNQDLNPTHEMDFIVCHYGNKSKYTGHCICKKGWKSPSKQVTPTTIPVHFCSIPSSQSVKSSWTDTARNIIATLEQAMADLHGMILYLCFGMLLSGITLSIIVHKTYTNWPTRQMHTIPYTCKSIPKGRDYHHPHLSEGKVEEWLEKICPEDELSDSDESDEFSDICDETDPLIPTDSSPSEPSDKHQRDEHDPDAVTESETKVTTTSTTTDSYIRDDSHNTVKKGLNNEYCPKCKLRKRPKNQEVDKNQTHYHISTNHCKEIRGSRLSKGILKDEPSQISKKNTVAFKEETKRKFNKAVRAEHTYKRSSSHSTSFSSWIPSSTLPSIKSMYRAVRTRSDSDSGSSFTADGD